jgi:DNA mismatch repair ATPase MutS
VYHEYKNHQERPFCFAQMSISKKPMLDIVDGWLPLIRSNHVGNSICLGGDDQSRNLLLTGPNGGGKSSLLKLMGGSVVLAHSWGIVPANACSMSLFAGLRTSFNPQEDIAHDISTFMAQKKRLGQLQKYVQQSDKANCYLLLVDEPYRGTIEAEAEKRAYQFGDYIAQYQQAMLVMASHLQQPIQLQEDTNLFINKQMQITSNDDGTFNRAFKLLDGAACWWFTDIEKRMQFIDWLHADI